MKTQIENAQSGKRVYSKPELKTVIIDNQISMVMMSDPPIEGVNYNKTMTNDPYKISRG